MTMTERASDMSPLETCVRRLRLHSPLSDADARLFKALPFKLSKLSPNSQPVREGDPTTSCMILVSGYMHRFRLTESGDRQIMAIYVPGDPIDFDRLYLPVADDSLQTIRETVVARVYQSDLRELMARRPAIAEAVIRLLLVDSSIFREWTLNVGRRDARARIAHLFAEIAVRLDAQGCDLARVPLPLTQDHIADATGLTPVHVNRTLKTLRAEGCIERLAGGLVVIPDLDALKAVGGFDGRYLHLVE